MKTPTLLEGNRIMCACGEEQCYKALEIRFDQLTVYRDVSDRDEEFLVFELPSNVALVKYVDLPKADWSQAPEWAMHWRVDPNGFACWFQEEPVLSLTVSYCGWIPKTINGVVQGATLWACEIDLALGIDWRTLKERRPEVRP